MSRYSEDEPGFSATPFGGAERLIPCTTCGHQISREAEACPQCGHPNKPAPRAPAGLSCYACTVPATTRCQGCGTLSCAIYVQSVFVPHGKGGANELRCQACYDSAMTWNAIRWGFALVGLVVAAIFFFGFFLPSWNQASRQIDDGHREMDERWRKKAERDQ